MRLEEKPIVLPIPIESPIDSERNPTAPSPDVQGISRTEERSKTGAEIQVYSRRQTRKRNKAAVTNPHNHDLEPRKVMNSETDPGNPLIDKNVNDHTSLDFESSNNMDMPIAIRKGTRSCTQHSLSNFIS